MSSFRFNTSKQGIPFYSQIWNLTKWKEFGFQSYEDAQYWQDSSCGILCLKMAIEGLLTKEIDPVSELIRKGVKMSAYSYEKGWSHKGLVSVADFYGVNAYSVESLTEAKLKKILSNGGLIIVSIKWAFQPTKSWKERLLFWKKRGGHLALITTYEEKGFIINHTSISPGFNWEGKLIPFKEFNQGFTGRGIVITNSNKTSP